MPAKAAVAALLFAGAAHGTQIAGHPSKVQADGAFALAELVQGEPAAAPSAALMALRGSVPDNELLPIGEGAYQSGEAVMQRTKDERMACEKSEIYFRAHWAECFKYQGDFVDGPTHGFKNIAAGAIGNKHAIRESSDEDTSAESTPSSSGSGSEGHSEEKSGAASMSVVCTTAVVVATLLRGL
eukprot:TRINITY_DN641_c0_g1_i1.p2 TRINITY_DN641_c0_g1~~TRINITY_DN641_c0_g1_i1.p2  ORF type:complete len:184 (-),score=57.32 TRINITY_DN641_c0_g1_i1:149-700(-)